MEALLSVSFDNISSRDNGKIRKGLRQIEGLLVQICLGTPNSKPNRKDSAAIILEPSGPQHKRLSELKNDAAFREFFRLQEGFQWNVASRIVATIERLMGMGNPSQTDLLILSALDVLHGVLLLHPPSRSLFNREIYMNLLLDLLDSSNPPNIQSQAMLVLVAALLDSPRNTRTFEKIDGLLTVTSLFRSRSTTKDVKLRTMEFFYFYLMPEAATPPSIGAAKTSFVQINSDKQFHALPGHARTHSGDSGGGVDIDADPTKTTAEKQRMLDRYLSNVADLVHDLHHSTPFALPNLGPSGAALAAA